MEDWHPEQVADVLVKITDFRARAGGIPAADTEATATATVDPRDHPATTSSGDAVERAAAAGEEEARADGSATASEAPSSGREGVGSSSAGGRTQNHSEIVDGKEGGWRVGSSFVC